jgi:hypothetical protein
MCCIALVRSLCRLKLCFSLRKDTTPPQPNHTVTATHFQTEQYNTWNKSTIKRRLLKMDVLTFETCWAVNSEIIKQVTSSLFIFIQLNLNFCWYIDKRKCGLLAVSPTVPLQRHLSFVNCAVQYLNWYRTQAMLWCVCYVKCMERWRWFLWNSDRFSGSINEFSLLR